MRWFLRNRYLLGVDLVGWTLIPLATLALRLDGLELVGRYLPHLVAFAVLAAIAKFASLWFLGLYRRYWRYASIDELFLISAAIVGAGIAAAVLYFFVAVPALGVQG